MGWLSKNGGADVCGAEERFQEGEEEGAEAIAPASWSAVVSPHPYPENDLLNIRARVISLLSRLGGICERPRYVGAYRLRCVCDCLACRPWYQTNTCKSFKPSARI